MHLCANDPFVQNSEFHNVTVEEILDVTPKIKRFFLRYPVPVSFKSGQFVIIDFGTLPHRFSTRSYSIADYSSGNVLELIVVLKEDGAATPLLFHQRPGDVLKASLPQGRFVLPDELVCPAFCFICTGTGVAPFRAMIKDLLLHRAYKGKVWLFFGCRTRPEILYREEFEKLASDYPNFTYVPVLSRENWDGATGYVHAHYQSIFSSKPEAMFYLCGWTDMLRETRDNLKSYGYSRTDIKVEFYD